jgi:hypothetical protein
MSPSCRSIGQHCELLYHRSWAVFYRVAEYSFLNVEFGDEQIDVLPTSQFRLSLQEDVSGLSIVGCASASASEEQMLDKQQVE